MSRTKKAARKNTGKGGGRAGGSAASDPSANPLHNSVPWWSDTAQMKNAGFEKYYKGQGILPDSAEGEEFLATLKKDLPTSFRITAGRHFTRQTMRALKDEYFPALRKAEFDGEPIPEPEELPWYPNELGWQIDVKKSILRKQEAFKKFQGWLVHETTSGVISRQEAVSMVPPLFLNVQSHHLVLDLCAAPGSKTAQLLEGLHAPLLAQDGQPAPGGLASHETIPVGMVIANDSDAKRSNLLKHQAARFASPNLLITNTDARFYPNLTVPYLDDQADEKGRSLAQVQHREIRYDRILADVPCSGDGTLRKNPLIWRDWTFAIGNGLHKMQRDILLRGLNLLAPGGRLVYSTCSLNPIENEAVVAGALSEYNSIHATGVKSEGEESSSSEPLVELIDTRDHPEFARFRSLKRRPGMTEWRVTPLKNLGTLRKARRKNQEDMAKAAAAAAATAVGGEQSTAATNDTVKEEESAATIQKTEPKVGATGEPEEASTAAADLPWVDSWDSLHSEFPDESRKVAKTFWPPPSGPERDALHLERCMRIYPHDQNSGGFFVAVLEKKQTSANGKNREVGNMAPGIQRGIEALDRQKKDESAATTSQVGAKREREEEQEENIAPAGKKGKGPSGKAVSVNQADEGLDSSFREHPYSYLANDNECVLAFKEYYSLSDDFCRNLMVRNNTGDAMRMVYYTAPVVRGILTGGGEATNPDAVHKLRQTARMRLIYTGNKLFARQGALTTQTAGEDDDDSAEAEDVTAASIKTKQRTLAQTWRITDDGKEILHKVLPANRKFSMSIRDLQSLLMENCPRLDDVEPAELRTRLAALASGSHIVEILAGTDEALGARLDDTILLSIWKAPASVGIMLDKQERSAVSFRIYGKDIITGSSQRTFTQQKHGRNKEQTPAASAYKTEPADGGAAEGAEADVSAPAIDIDDDAALNG